MHKFFAVSEDKKKWIEDSVWCPYPFQQLMVSPIGELRPCCRFESGDNKLIWDGKQSLNQAYLQPDFENVRRSLLKEEKVSACNSCYREEAEGVPSMRQKSILAMPEVNPHEVQLRGIEIGVGRLCNLACRTCDSTFSTKWDADSRILHGRNDDFVNELDLDGIPADFFSSMLEMKVTGGEPFLHVQFIRLLARIVEAGHAAQMELEIFSNAARKPPQVVLDYFPHFKKVTISLSIDGVGAVNDYIRSPARWVQTAPVVEWWTQIAAESANIRLCIATTVSIFNVLDLFPLFNWVGQLKKSPKIILQVVHSPSYLSILKFPVRIKQELLKEFTRRDLEFRARHEVSDILRMNIDKVYSFLKSTGGSEDTLVDFFRNTTVLDDLRRQSFTLTFPKLAEILSHHQEEVLFAADHS